MRERPILFSGPMVRAIIDGRKSQTRRVLNPQPPAIAGLYYRHCGHALFAGYMPPGEPAAIPEVSSPYGEAGDRLWVRETWRVGAWSDDGMIAVDYRADNFARREWLDLSERFSSERFNRLWEQSTDDARDAGAKIDRDGRYRWKPGNSPCRWRPGIHMPRAACRLVLEVTAVRVERLQDISDADALAEGVERCNADWSAVAPQMVNGSIHCDRYARLWDSINAKRAPWGSNPWVWVVEFKRAA